MSDVDFSNELAAFDGDFAKAPTDTGDGKVPDGKYQFRIQDAQLARAQTSGAPMLKFKLRIEGPASIGRIVWRNSVIAADKLEWLKRDLVRLGLSLGKLSELPAQLPTLKGVLFEGTAKTNGEYQNIYVDKRLNEAGGPPASSAGAEFGGGATRGGFTPSGDDVPF